jgi:hypothetical protein
MFDRTELLHDFPPLYLLVTIKGIDCTSDCGLVAADIFKMRLLDAIPPTRKLTSATATVVLPYSNNCAK